MSEAVKCKDHPNFSGLRAPKRTPKNPDGCPTCWEYHRQHKHDLAEQARPKRQRSARAVDSQLRLAAQEFSGGKLKVEVDADTGDTALIYGTRCLYVCSSDDELHAFISGFREGMRFNGKSYVGEE